MEKLRRHEIESQKEDKFKNINRRILNSILRKNKVGNVFGLFIGLRGLQSMQSINHTEKERCTYQRSRNPVFLRIALAIWFSIVKVESNELRNRYNAMDKVKCRGKWNGRQVQIPIFFSWLCTSLNWTREHRPTNNFALACFYRVTSFRLSSAFVFILRLNNF